MFVTPIPSLVIRVYLPKSTQFSIATGRVRRHREPFISVPRNTLRVALPKSIELRRTGRPVDYSIP